MINMIKKILYAILTLVIAFTLYVLIVSEGFLGRYESPGEIINVSQPASVMQEKILRHLTASKKLNVNDTKMILFGDFHVHTTFSIDAFMLGLPMLSGEGTHPPADACDFARFCSSLDFWANTDHAEALTPTDWKEIKDTVRQCNNVSKGSSTPDTVAFLGWEWTNMGGFGLPHYGHKNVILRGIEDDELPSRPIASYGLNGGFNVPYEARIALSALNPFDKGIHDLMRYIKDAEVSTCEEGIPVRDLPSNCKEYAKDSKELFAKLNDWGHEAIVIPHGTTWGLYTPQGSDWRDQLNDQDHDPNLQTMIEIFSGHGNSEEYRNWRSVLVDKKGDKYCPQPSKDFLPGCWRAGEIIESRCLSEGKSSSECSLRAHEARQNYVNDDVGGHLTVQGERASDWLDANQCKDCFQPSFNYRPASSAQYMLALKSFDQSQKTNRFKFAFMASSDNHTARPGTGYKEANRREMTEASGARDPSAFIFNRRNKPSLSTSIPQNLNLENLPGGVGLFETERGASFFLNGGLIAVHSDGRNRDSIWEALDRKEVYGTSGPRILLWFDLINSLQVDKISMGSSVKMNTAPRFIVRTAGSLEQKPGCPDYAINSLGEKELEHLCKGECYNPSDVRRKINRIEVVRIRPQNFNNENINNLIEDPWKTFKCPDNQSECIFTFSDKEFEEDKRDTVYYVRAIEEQSKAVNAANLRCEYDENNRCSRTNICHGSSMLTPYEDDCLSVTEERAWSSPIYVDYSSL